MWAAVERFVSLDHQTQQQEWQQRIATIEKLVTTVPTVQTQTIVPPIANQVPHLLVFWNEQRVRITRQEVKQQLAGGEPSIVTTRVHGTGSEGFLISVFMLEPNEEVVVGTRLQQILQQALT